jgi:methionine-rich copper-binding protein CopC
MYNGSGGFMKNVFGTAVRVHMCLGILIVIILVLAVPLAALAHAKMLRSTPGAGDVSQPPPQVELWFNELLDAKFNSIAVFPAAELNAKPRTSLTKGEAQVDPQDRTHLIVPLKPLPPGNYMVEWRVLSLDGHSAPGRFEFRVLGSK